MKACWWWICWGRSINQGDARVGTHAAPLIPGYASSPITRLCTEARWLYYKFHTYCADQAAERQFDRHASTTAPHYRSLITADATHWVCITRCVLACRSSTLPMYSIYPACCGRASRKALSWLRCCGTSTGGAWTPPPPKSSSCAESSKRYCRRTSSSAHLGWCQYTRPA